jgi:outer membrane protein assembly factor BamB
MRLQVDRRRVAEKGNSYQLCRRIDMQQVIQSIRTLFFLLLFAATLSAGIIQPNQGLVVYAGIDKFKQSPVPGTLVVSVDVIDGNLPLVNNLVNLLLTDDSVPKSEMLRVLAPGGVAIAGRNRITKPATQGTDEWTHFLHGPENNAVSKDRVVDFPEGLQWIAGPTWTRDHDSTPSLSCQVTSGGRLFYVHDQGPIGVIDERVPTKTYVIARDAYNGVLLWKYRVPDWYPSHQQWGTVPVTLNQRLVAIGDTVYLTKGLHGPVVALDAATGREKLTVAGSEESGEILVVDGMLIAGIRKEAPRASDQYPTLRSTPFRGGRGVKGLLSGSQIKVFDAQRGELRWESNTVYRASTVASDGERLLYSGDKALICHDVVTGKKLWSTEGRFSKVMLQDGVAVCIKEEKRNSISVQAVELAGGKVLWSQSGQTLPTFKHCFYIPPEVFIIKGRVWVKAAKGESLVRLDLRSGKVVKTTSMTGGMTGGHHVRCYPAKATERYLLLNKRGIEFVDQEGKFTKHDWVRGQCRMGIMPANGMIYIPPNGCNCGIESYVRGMQALHPRQALEPVADNVRLTKGPAFGKARGGESKGWPTFRRDYRRTASRDQSMKLSMDKAWQKSSALTLTTATATGDSLYLGEGEQVLAIDLASGKERWRFDAPIDSPPSIVGGMVVFGSRDGYVYNLRASDGKLIWRFLAAPVDRRHVAFGRLESVWGCHGSVLFKDDTIYVAAGRSSFLDGGIYIYGLDINSGALRYRNVLKTTQPQQTDRLDTYNCRGALPDILVTDGDFLYMRQMKFDWELKLLSGYHPFEGRTPGSVPRVQASSGFLDNSENKRVQRVAGTQWGGRYSPMQTQQLSLHDGINYGCRVYWNKGWKSPRYHTGDGTYVFACDLKTQPERIQTMQKKGSDSSIRGGPPASFFNRQPEAMLEWETRLPIKAMATVIVGNKLLVAGRHDRDVEDMKARADGRDSGALCVLDRKSGEVLETVDLSCVPQLDGMLVTGDRIVITGGRELVVLGR